MTLTVTAVGAEVGVDTISHNFSGGKGGDKDLPADIDVTNDLDVALDGAVVSTTLHNVTLGGPWAGSATTEADG